MKVVRLWNIMSYRRTGSSPRGIAESAEEGRIATGVFEEFIARAAKRILLHDEKIWRRWHWPRRRTTIGSVGWEQGVVEITSGRSRQTSRPAHASGSGDQRAAVASTVAKVPGMLHREITIRTRPRNPSWLVGWTLVPRIAGRVAVWSLSSRVGALFNSGGGTRPFACHQQRRPIERVGINCENEVTVSREARYGLRAVRVGEASHPGPSSKRRRTQRLRVLQRSWDSDGEFWRRGPHVGGQSSSNIDGQWFKRRWVAPCAFSLPSTRRCRCIGARCGHATRWHAFGVGGTSWSQHASACDGRGRLCGHLNPSTGGFSIWPYLPSAPSRPIIQSGRPRSSQSVNGGGLDERRYGWPTWSSSWNTRQRRKKTLVHPQPPLLVSLLAGVTNWASTRTLPDPIAPRPGEVLRDIHHEGLLRSTSPPPCWRLTGCADWS